MINVSDCCHSGVIIPNNEPCRCANCREECDVIEIETKKRENFDKYEIEKADKIRVALGQLFGSRPPKKLIVEKLSDIINEIYDDGYSDGYNNI